MTLTCPYCGYPAEITTGARVYPQRRDLAGLPFWHCASCDAVVGCHPGTMVPLGTLANKATRRLRAEVHRVFDPVWKFKRFSGHMPRVRAYEWLAAELGITVAECHVGMFDDRMCRRAIEVCAARAKEFLI